jgi:acylphosphatase
MPSDAIRVRVVVHGRVQGVFFRDTCRQEATRVGVAGWVRNRADGTVEAVFEGERRQVERMVAWVHEGPPYARVVRVETEDQTPLGIAGFDVR